MIKVLAGSGALALSLACAAAPPPVPAAPNRFRASADSAAAAMTRQLALWGFNASQRDSGQTSFISGSLRLPRGQKLAGHQFGYWADCGKELGLSRAYTSDEMRVQISARIEPKNDPSQQDVPTQSHAIVLASFTGLDRQALGDPTIRCSSRGLLEQALLNEVHAQSKGFVPPKAVPSDGPYALSVRPGDSLSLPLAEDPGLSQPATLKECALAPDQAYLIAEGEVRYAVTAEGIPDTATLTVRSSRGVDGRTFQSAARKMVANCRFQPRTLVAGESTSVVHQRLFFGAPNALDYAAKGDVVISHDSPADSLMVRHLEEATMLSCPAVTGPTRGRVELQFVVGVDGKPEPATLRAVNATSPEIATVGLGIVLKCRFKPAQFNGRPVRSLIRLPMTMD
jgi:hypothetical protein